MRVTLTPKGEQYVRSMWSVRDKLKAAIDRIPAHELANMPDVSLLPIGDDYEPFVRDGRLDP